MVKLLKYILYIFNKEIIINYSIRLQLFIYIFFQCYFKNSLNESDICSCSDENPTGCCPKQHINQANEHEFYLKKQIYHLQVIIIVIIIYLIDF